MEERKPTPPEPRRTPGEDPDQDPGGPHPPRWNQRSWVWFMIFAFFLFMMFNHLGSQLSGVLKVDSTSFIAEVRGGKVAELEEGEPLRTNVARIEEVEVGVLVAHLIAEREYPTGRAPDAPMRSTRKIRANFPTEDPLRETVSRLAEARDIPIDPLPPGSGLLDLILFQFLMLFLIIGVFWFLSNRVRRQMGPGMFGRFSGNRAKRYDKSASPVTFEDVAGLKNVKTELREVVDFLQNPERYAALGAKIPKGVLLVGPPGTGKTLMARAVAGEAGVPFFSISGSEFIELFVGVGASRVRELFEEAKKASPCIIFIDEIDAVGRSRGAGLGGGHDEREQTLNQILSEMDGFESTQAVIVLAATNRPDVLDPALVRPGRFDRQVVVERPQKEGRKAILEVHTRQIPLDRDVDLDAVARATIGFSGADLQNLANEAALMAARDMKKKVDMACFEKAKDKILLGTLRDESVSQREKEITAYHEAGHALLALLLPGADPVHSVTIVPRGRALGVTQQLPAEEIYNYSRTYLLNRVVILLGGRAAEELVFDERTTGAENDLQQATQLVERMICRWGMSEKIGPVSFRRGEEHVFLGREIGEGKHFSEHTAMLIDDEIRRMVEEGSQRALDLLSEHRGKLERLTEELLEKEVITDRELYELLEFPLPDSLREPEEEAAPATSDPGVTPSRAPERRESPGDSIDPGLLGLGGA